MHVCFLPHRNWHVHVRIWSVTHLHRLTNSNVSGFSYEPYPELKFESKLFVAGMESGSTAQRGAFVICPQVRFRLYGAF